MKTKSNKKNSVRDPDKSFTRQSSSLGPIVNESEANHLKRVASELSRGDLVIFEDLVNALDHTTKNVRINAAVRLAQSGDRRAIGVLRDLLESETSLNWETAVAGLRRSNNRSAWLCLENAAQKNITLLSNSDHQILEVSSFRLLVMGRTKTMDRLFRAIDGHSKSISRIAALNFSNVAIKSLPKELYEILAMRLGLLNDSNMTLDEISNSVGKNKNQIRDMESKAWELIQKPRSFKEIIEQYRLNT